MHDYLCHLIELPLFKLDARGFIYICFWIFGVNINMDILKGTQGIHIMKLLF